jgi:hypothetical protein
VLENPNHSELLTRALVDMSIDSWRFAKAFAKMVGKVDAGEAVRYDNQYRYYVKRIGENLARVGLRVVSVEGAPYDPGIAVTALNIADFEPNDLLLIDQMIEPIIMGVDTWCALGPSC